MDLTPNPDANSSSSERVPSFTPHESHVIVLCAGHNPNNIYNYSATLKQQGGFVSTLTPQNYSYENASLQVKADEQLPFVHPLTGAIPSAESPVAANRSMFALPMLLLGHCPFLPLTHEIQLDTEALGIGG